MHFKLVSKNAYRDLVRNCRRISISELSDSEKREAWQHLFNYYVFKTMDNPSEHLPPKLKDIVTELSSEQELKVRNFLAEKLK